MGKKSKTRPGSLGTNPIKTVDIGSLEKPIANITPHVWRVLEKDTKELNIDLFRPIDLGDTPPASGAETPSSLDQLLSPTDLSAPIFRYDDLRPLLQFRQLRHLKLTGMMQSYQPLIWATCWLSPFLKTVHLEMALSPLFNLDTDHPHRLIDTMWSLNNVCRTNPNNSEYLGHHGDGSLHDEFGEGEYLDSQAIKMSQLDVAKDIPFNNLRYLPIEKLTLMNFVVDGGAILRWFDPKRLQELDLKEGCIDAGLYLCEQMNHVKVTSPKPCPPPQVARVIKRDTVKTLEMKKGKVVSRKDAQPSREEGALGMLRKPPGLKAKISQVMHGFGGGKHKENKLVVPVEKRDDDGDDNEVKQMGD